ncbi:MAG: beta-N-acetylhexosaminidase, partial [Ignavibacteriales bacterium]|nr:beta-N-acetylhexosaminidase [Ignavibacteriales bacterium]
MSRQPVLSTFASLLTLSLICLTTSMTQTKEPPVEIIPTPQSVTRSPGTFRISSQTLLVLADGAGKDDRFAADQLNEALVEQGAPPLKIVAEGSLRKRPSNFILIGTAGSKWARDLLKARSCRLTAEMKDEGYVLDVGSDGILIVAESPRGRFYAVQTLLQLVYRDKRVVQAPRVSIHDWPLQKMRGITDDLSRGQVSTLENFKKIIRFLARYKLNIYS